jgi:hypothetical protein
MLQLYTLRGKKSWKFCKDFTPPAFSQINNRLNRGLF